MSILRSAGKAFLLSGAITLGAISFSGLADAAQPGASHSSISAPTQQSCGFRSVRISQHESSAYWRNCVSHGQRINVDRAFWPDFQVCVPQGQDRYLGAGLIPVGPGAIRGATVIGSC